MQANLINIAYLIASILFIVGLKGLTSPRTAVRGNFFWRYRHVNRRAGYISG